MRNYRENIVWHFVCVSNCPLWVSLSNFTPTRNVWECHVPRHLPHGIQPNFLVFYISMSKLYLCVTLICMSFVRTSVSHLSIDLRAIFYFLEIVNSWPIVIFLVTSRILNYHFPNRRISTLSLIWVTNIFLTCHVFFWLWQFLPCQKKNSLCSHFY